MERLFVCGAGGQGRVVIDTLKNGLVDYGLSAIIDDDERLHGTTMSGREEVGEGALLGVGTVVVPGIRIGRKAFIPAGQTVTRGVPDGGAWRHATTGRGKSA